MSKINKQNKKKLKSINQNDPHPGSRVNKLVHCSSAIFVHLIAYWDFWKSHGGVKLEQIWSWIWIKVRFMASTFCSKIDLVGRENTRSRIIKVSSKATGKSMLDVISSWLILLEDLPKWVALCQGSMCFCFVWH